jgi:hypothetical protein
MPTLDDTPIIETFAAVDLLGGNVGATTVIATQDLVLVYDVSTQKIKAITVANFLEATTTGSAAATSGDL